jgi:hypothetical protein
MIHGQRLPLAFTTLGSRSVVKASGYGPIDDKSARGGCQGGGGDDSGEGRVDRWRNVRVLRGVVAEWRIFSSHRGHYSPMDGVLAYIIVPLE